MSDSSLPAYRHVPGRTPHPISDPRGHSYGSERPQPKPFDPHQWTSSPEYLRGLKLFNHGYYWEAHEEWEAIWHLAEGEVAGFLKGLIQIAVAGVKVLQEKPEIMKGKLARAAELLRPLADRAPEARRYAGLRLDAIVNLLESDTLPPKLDAETD